MFGKLRIGQVAISIAGLHHHHQWMKKMKRQQQAIMLINKASCVTSKNLAVAQFSFSRAINETILVPLEKP